MPWGRMKVKSTTTRECSSCPLRGWFCHGKLSCLAGGTPSDTLPRKPPEDCPLRGGPILIELEKGE